MSIANSLITATAGHLSRFAPFDSMEAADLLWLAGHLSVVYFHNGEVLACLGLLKPHAIR